MRSFSTLVLFAFAGLLLAFAAFACSLYDPSVPGSPRSERSFEADTLLQRDTSAIESDSLAIRDTLAAGDSLLPQEPVYVPVPVVYTCGVEVPEGYDWAQDPLYGKIDCSLVLFRDSVRILEFPAGPAYEIGVDPDMHYIVDGHLLSIYYAYGETVLKCDGEPLLRYGGTERITDIIVQGLAEGEPEIWSIGTIESGTGFCYRHNGIAELTRSKAAYTDLYEDSGHIYFTYSSTVAGTKCLTLVEDGRERALSYANNVVPYDARMVEGDLVSLVTADKVCSYILHADGTKDVLNYTNFFFNTARFYEGDPGPIVTGVMNNQYREEKTDFYMIDYFVSCWDRKDEFYAYRAPEGVAFLSYNTDGSFMAQFGACNIETEEQHYRLFRRECGAYVDGEFYIALNEMESLLPVLWRSGEVTVLPLNGFLTCLSVNME